ncbi:hypothetical protein [Undibacterium crateris]|uniref:hypothetical protein n=1 Tax=Undibacterium crateris TaxID=2528175 RepID=UPI00138A449A|nr:hypothetical protein [Undibacterium crateris]NDI86809.1 hypothetical protein [Undibacterium crateris]
MIVMLHVIAIQNANAAQILELVRLIWEEMDIDMKRSEENSKLFLFGKYMRQLKLDAIFAAQPGK